MLFESHRLITAFSPSLPLCLTVSTLIVFFYWNRISWTYFSPHSHFHSAIESGYFYLFSWPPLYRQQNNGFSHAKSSREQRRRESKMCFKVIRLCLMGDAECCCRKMCKNVIFMVSFFVRSKMSCLWLTLNWGIICPQYCCLGISMVYIFSSPWKS